MKRLTHPARAAALLSLLWATACGSITPVESNGDGGLGSAGASGSGGAGGASTDARAGTGGAVSADASVQKDVSGPVDAAALDATDCMPGERRCDGDTPLTCSPSGTWQRGPACTNVCAGGSCVGVCTPGAKMCTGNIPQFCDGQGLWQAAPACMFVCRQGDCTGVCLPGTRQCSSSGAPQSCTADGAWDTGPTCPFVCSQGVCTGVCQPGQVGCNGDIPQRCSSTGDWQSSNPCTFVCTNGACAGSCTPGARQCAGNVPQTCGPGGAWQDGMTCPFVCSGGMCGGSCVPGGTRCTNGQKQICDASGNWQNTASPQVQLLANPGFDSGNTAWVEETLFSSLVITNDAALTSIKAQTPSYLGWLGGYDNARDDLYQVVSLPAGATMMTLTFWYAIFTAETTPGAYDTMDVYAYESSTGTYTPLASFNDNMPNPMWSRFSISLPSWMAGRTLQIGFRATTDVNKTTSFFVDSVSLDVTACTP